MAYTPPSALPVLINSPLLEHPTSIDMLRVIIQGQGRANSVYLEDQGDDIISNLVGDGHNLMLRSAEDVLAPSSIEILSAIGFNPFKLFLMISQISHFSQNRWLRYPEKILMKTNTCRLHNESFTSITTHIGEALCSLRNSGGIFRCSSKSKYLVKAIGWIFSPRQ
jgi:hypothetical protein